MPVLPDRSAPSLRQLWRLSPLLALALALAWPRPAAACTCMQPASPPGAFAQTPAIFSGTVTRITSGKTGPARILDPLLHWLGVGITSSADPLSVSVQVITAWKGVTATPVSVRTATSGASCGYRFVVGQPYLIYAFDDGAQLSTGLCTRTAPLSQAAADLAFLQTVPALTVAPAPASDLLLQLCLSLAGFLAGIPLLWLWSRWRRRLARQP
jgi:hypothetical protein